MHFCATCTRVEPTREIAWETAEGQRVRVAFAESDGAVELRQKFSADPDVDIDVQRDDWQGLLKNFAQHVARLSS